MPRKKKTLGPDEGAERVPAARRSAAKGTPKSTRSRGPRHTARDGSATTPDALPAALWTIGVRVRAVGVREVARRLGVSAGDVSRTIAGKRSPSLETLERLAGAVGLEVVARPKPGASGRVRVDG